MSSFTKFLIGLVLTGILAWFCQSILGHNKATIDDIQSRTQAAVQGFASSGIIATLPTAPMQRVVKLKGPVDTTPEQIAAAIAAAKALPGVANAVWDTGGAAAPVTVVSTASVAAPASAVVPATASEVANCQSKVNARIKDAVVEFASGKAIIAATSSDLLEAVAADVKDCAGVIIEVAGHTDATGQPAKNLVLSQARAAAVVAYLEAKGVPAGRLVPKGYGSTRPIDTSGTPEGNTKNRRIDFTVAAAR